MPMEGGALGRVRTAQVYAARWPGEEDGKAAAWWKRYVKPYLVAAAVDYSLPLLPTYSSLTDLVAKQYHDFRLSSLSAPPPRAMHTLLTPEEKRTQDLEGGIILVGRASLKEYMEGLRQGWREQPKDESKWLNELDDSIFDDPAKKDLPAAPTQEELVATEPKVNLFPLTHLPPSKMAPSSSPPTEPAPAPAPVQLPPTPSTLPAHPPLLLIPYHPNLGFTSIPRSIYQWFNTTAQVKLGGEAALAFILNQPSIEHDLTEAPSTPFTPSTEVRLEGESLRQGGGLVDWDLEVGEGRCMPKNFEKVPEQVEERMKAYYKALEGRVAKAWEIRNGRPYTDAELKHTPPTLDELKEERIKRERRARKDLEGYRILRKGSGVAWDEALEGRFGVWKWDEGADSTAGGGAGGVGGSEFV
ncbi:inner membrane protein import complex subunit Tim54-domain-containing protein [Mrakia frigida]|uniref:Tim22-complex subunit TIM54 n=1 Tax=Mrakia frigida TaxID=29902 RepID=UPI003FCC060A